MDAKWIYDEAKRLKIPLMAGSSLPVTWRVPAADVTKGAQLRQIVGVSYHTLDAYGFHGLEVLQCLAERRAGGETGIARVRCITGDEVWTSDLYDHDLLDQALARQKYRRMLDRGKTLQELVKEPVLFAIDYEDGLRTALLTLKGAVAEWSAAWRYADDTTASTLFALPEHRPYPGFINQVRGIEQMMHTGKPTWPAERTLLTSGTLDALLISLRDGGDWLETPHLGLSYATVWEWSQPAQPLRGWKLPRKPRPKKK